MDEHEVYEYALKEFTDVCVEHWRKFQRPILKYQSKECDYRRTIRDAFFRGFNLGKRVAERKEVMDVV
jgi:hypothetical protein